MVDVKVIGEEKYLIPYKRIRGYKIIGIGLPEDQLLIYINVSLFKKIMNHCNEYRHKKLEAMGFLLGNVYKFHKGNFLAIEDVVTTELDATAISVKFSKKGFSGLFNKMDLNDRQIIGWYHSHPGYTAFMSETDINTQKGLFPKPYHVAIVVDPINHDIKAFSLIKGKIVDRILFVHTDMIVDNDTNDTTKSKR